MRNHPIDVITTLYLLVSAALAAAWRAAPWLVSLYLLYAAAAWFLTPYIRKSGSGWKVFLSAWYPVLGFTLLYLATSPLNAASPIPPLDPWLNSIDHALFGAPLCDLFSSAFPQRAFAELMAFFYFSYYLMIPGLGLWLWFRARPVFPSFVFTTAFCFYFFYLVFALFPSAGPQFYLRAGALEWTGYIFGPLLTLILESIEVPTGAFPSSHVGVALIVTCFAWRYNRKAGVLFTVLCSGLSLAILYGGPHYFIDLPCGLAVGTAFYFLAPPVKALLQRSVKLR